MNKEQRLAAILNILNQNGKVQISDLIEKFNVSDMTIRRDFDCLVSRGQITRTHGGAVLSENSNQEKSLPVTLEPAYLTRVNEQAEYKEEIAQNALQLIKPNQFVFLDSGTTTLYIAQMIPKDFPCTFITNGVNVAITLLSKQFPNVLIIGGEADLNTWSSRGTLAESQISSFHADIAFLGCNAVSPSGNVMVGNTPETGIKHKIMDISDEIYLLADSSKFGSYSLISYASVNDFHGVITDRYLPQNIQKGIQDLGGKFIFSDN